MTVKTRGGNVLVNESEGGSFVICYCCCEEIELNSAGGDEGYEETFELVRQLNEYPFIVVFTAFRIPDALILKADGQVIYESGCIGTQLQGQPRSVTEEVIMPAGARTLTILVDPNCAGPTTGTLWTLLVDGVCVKP